MADNFLMAKSHPWEIDRSRDYALSSIACNAIDCPANRRGQCVMPSAIVIGSNFRCVTGDGLTEEKRRLEAEKAQAEKQKQKKKDAHKWHYKHEGD